MIMMYHNTFTLELMLFLEIFHKADITNASHNKAGIIIVKNQGAKFSFINYKD